jgi:hypothetical protein
VTTGNGHADVLFADGRPGKTRTVAVGDAEMEAAAEFAFVSEDGRGLRRAVIVGGTLLRTPSVTLAPAARERSGEIIAAEYTERRMVLDNAWPAARCLAGRVFEVGVPGHMTTYTIAAAGIERGATVIALTEGADFYLSRVRAVVPEEKTVYCALAFTHCEKRPCPGVDRHWVASNESQDRFWRAEYLGDIDGTNRYAFRLDGPVSEADFGATRGIRLWEYGLGDSVRQSTFASLRRTGEEVYEITADVDLTVGIKGRELLISTDMEKWRRLRASAAPGGLVEADIDLARVMPAGRAYLRVR